MRCHTSIAKTLGLVGVGILMLAASWFCTTLPQAEARIAGWIGLAFFGLCFIAIVAQLFRGGASVILDDAGIHDLRSSFGTIPWADILSLRIGSVESQRFLCVYVRDPGIYLARLPSHKRLIAQANPALGFPPVTIGFAGLSPGLDEVWNYVQTNYPEKIAAA